MSKSKKELAHDQFFYDLCDATENAAMEGLHSAWVNKILTIIDDVETVADEMTSQGLVSMNNEEVDKYESIE